MHALSLTPMPDPPPAPLFVYSLDVAWQVTTPCPFAARSPATTAPPPAVPRVREAVCRLTACDPPLLVRVRGGARRWHGGRAVEQPPQPDRTAEAIALLRQALALLEGGQ